ncbi:mandelate racemase/muconate lactonizing enzyme family protein [uncultured Paludibaculum sp.]|uniref:mandelate racemase/muconate lactonizing enzyme family protein n=1 Tax=uncultured Paludibaculum sp. TaxID=1765020 RepID=UPI002AAB529A|nr:mandelate racemase/muconate lactonizing enzyme family protein [uncultured Paludibaculum sp.]
MTRIVQVEAIPVRLPRNLEEATGTAGSPSVLRNGASDYRWSASVPAIYSRHFETALIKVTLDNGLTGWGEAQAPLAPQVACAVADRLLAPMLVDTEFVPEPTHLSKTWHNLYGTMRVRGQTGGFMLDAISGVDLALWDLAGQMRQLSVSALIAASAARPKVPAYLSGLPSGSFPERCRFARDYQAQGFGCFKIFHEAAEGELFQLLDELRDALGATAQLAVDALWRLDGSRADAFGRQLDRRHAVWLECPFMPEEAGAHARLAEAIHTPLAAGESYRTRYEIAPVLPALRFVQPDLGRTGITEGLRIAQLATAGNAAVLPHVSIALGPQIAAAIHFAAAIENAPLLEFNPSVFEVANRFLEEPLQVEDAHWQVPRTPGLGIRVKEAELRAAIRW